MKTQNVFYRCLLLLVAAAIWTSCSKDTGTLEEEALEAEEVFEDSAEIVGGKVQNFPKSIRIEKNRGGCQNGICKKISIPASTKGYEFEYQVKFPSNMEWSRGGKVPGLAPTRSNSGCNAGDNWSFRLMWREGGNIIPYIYFGGQTENCGVNYGYRDNPVKSFRKGKWEKVKLRMTLNSASNKSDGTAVIWINGQKFFERTNMRWWKDSKSNIVDNVMMHVYRGGSDATWHASTDATIKFRGAKVKKL